MILSKNQIYRYMSQMLIPEISEKGQEKLMCSKVLFYSESLEAATLALYYLVAVGIGEIHCCIDDPTNCGVLQDKLSDLNSDTRVFFTSEDLLGNPTKQVATRIITGSPGYVLGIAKNIILADKIDDSIPTVIAMTKGWHGASQTFTTRAELERFTVEMSIVSTDLNHHTDEDTNRLSSYFSSLLAVIEHLKLALNIGKPMDNALYHNLATMEFTSASSTQQLLQKLERSDVSADLKHEAFVDSRVLIAGCGGLGSPAAYALASLGIGKLGLLDPGIVELSNLNHQIMHTSSRLGMSKARSSEIFLKEINPEIKLEVYTSALADMDLDKTIRQYDIVIGCMDSKHGGYLLKDACAAAGKPFMQAGALDISGLATSIIPGEGYCCRCIFPETESSDPIPACSETGVLGPVPGVMGIIQATEAVKLLSGVGESLKDRTLLFDVFDTDLYVVNNAKDSYCELCRGE